MSTATAPTTAPLRDRTGALLSVPHPIEQLIGHTIQQVWHPMVPDAKIRVRVLDVGWDRLRTPGSNAPRPCALVQVSWCHRAPGGYPSFRLETHFVTTGPDGAAVSRPVSGEVRHADGPMGLLCARAQGWLLGANLDAAFLTAALDRIWCSGDVALSPYPMDDIVAPFPIFFSLSEAHLTDPVRLVGDQWLSAASAAFSDGHRLVVVSDPVIEDRSGLLPRLSLRGTYRIHRLRLV